MRFLVDAQLPPALARWLGAQGFEAEHAADVGLEASPDSALWARALANKAILVSKDEDFVNLVLVKNPSPQLVWVRSGNTRKARVLADFGSSLDRIVAALKSGERIVELRGG